MTPFQSLTAALAVSLLPTLALAHEGIHVTDPYAIVTSLASKTGAVYFVIENHGPDEDRLLSATTDAAARADLHGSAEDANGVVSMRPMTEGLTVPGMTNHALKRGGDHLMLMGLTGPLADGDTFEVILTFAREGEVRVTVPVDNKREPGDAPMGGMDHGHAAPTE